MELQQFITQSLVQIAKGVAEAQTELVGHGTLINPEIENLFPSASGTPGNSLGWAKADQKSPVFMVDFDVAVTALDGTSTKGGIGVVAGVFALGSQGQSSNQNTSVSRLQFKVPIKLRSE